jgi:class 3 adenylate cyclase/CheY-like chemotaxis protein
MASHMPQRRSLDETCSPQLSADRESAGSNATRIVNILVLDLDVTSIYVIETMFSMTEVNVIHDSSLDNPDDVGDYLLNNDISPNLIILDISIPTSRIIVQRIRSKFNSSTLPILLSATSRYENEIYECLDLGANDFVYKPYRYKELQYRVSNLLQFTKYVKIDSILSDILPTDIISNLELGINFITKYHPHVTILFSDICSYTHLSTVLPTRRIIHMLNTMFCGFDDICIANGVYKVETIGDAYMIASGHDGTADHVDRMIRCALLMLKFMQTDENMSTVSIRIGIHTGTAHSGVIGKIRPRYCFFGDVVNTASRMESSGVPDKIQISDSVFALIADKSKYTTELRGDIDIKGKGIMKTYLISCNSTTTTS